MKSRSPMVVFGKTEGWDVASRKVTILLGLTIALSISVAARADDIPCPVPSIAFGTVPSLPDPWYWWEGQTWENPERQFRLLQGKEMVVCSYRNVIPYHKWGDHTFTRTRPPYTPLKGHYVLVAVRRVTLGVPPETYSCPFNSVQTKISTALPPHWAGVTYPFTLHEKRLDADGGFVACAYKGPDVSVAPTSPSAIVRPLKLDYPQLTVKPKPGLGLTQAFAVTLVNLTTVSPSPQKTVPCPAKVQMNGQIQVNGPGLVRYRLIHSGKPEPVQNMSFSEAGSKAAIFDLTVGAKSPAANPGGTLAQAPPSAPGVIEGLAHIEIIEPLAGMKASNDASYSLKCQPTAPGGLAISPTKPPGGGL